MSQPCRRWFLSAGAALLAACSDSTDTTPLAVQLAFTVEPSDATAGIAFDPVVAVAIQDASGNTVTSATNLVTVTIGTNPGGGTLTGTVSAAAVNGVATFSNLHVDKVGTGYTLTAAANGLQEATSTGFTIAAAPATRLVFTVQPSNTMGGAAITPPVQVAAQDSVGNLATEFQGIVTIALGGNPAPGTLSGTTAVSAVSGVATFSDLSIAPANAGYTLTASAGGLTGITSAPFAIAKPTAWIYITTATSGSPPDPDGYAACVDPASDGHGGSSCAYAGPHPIGVNGAVTVTVDTGAHVVLLTGVAANCTVAGDNPRTVHLSRGEAAGVSFAASCAPPVLHITTSTTGVSLDPDGYYLCMDLDYEDTCGTYAAIGVNSALTLPVAPGIHFLGLEGVADNCAISGDNYQSVDTDVTTEVRFVITCVAAGTVHVTTASTGTDVDPDGYVVCVDGPGNACRWSLGVAPNGAVTIPGVFAGPHIVIFSGVAGNCTVSGATNRAVTVPPEGTVDVTFDVACVLAERIAFSHSGTLAVVHADGSAARPIAAGFAPAWSRDGARLAYECGQDICAINADSTGFARLTVDAAGNHHPTWSPDGLKIAFAATHAGVADLYVMGSNGTAVVRLTQGVGFLGSPAWSPDGTRIAFDCREAAGNDDICVVNADGTGFARLTSDPARDYGAAWKPDGSMLAFSTRRHGGDEIALLTANGGGVARLGAGLPGFAPTWSQDGSELALVQLYENCDDYGCYSEDTIFVATPDGANLRYVTAGDQPAWKPHP